MKRIFIVPLAIFLAVFCSCQKQQTEEERNAEIERRVEQRLASERQAQTEQELAERQAELKAREKALAEKQQVTAQAAATVSAETPLHAAKQPTASYSTFHNKLEPYGAWRETPITVSYGNPTKPSGREVGGLTRTGAGFIPTRAGHGYPRSLLAGPPIIMDAGRVCETSDGCGCQEKNGRLRGCRGAKATIISAGRPCLPKRVSIAAQVSKIGLTVITISVQSNTASFRPMSLARVALRRYWFHPRAT